MRSCLAAPLHEPPEGCCAPSIPGRPASLNDRQHEAAARLARRPLKGALPAQAVDEQAPQGPHINAFVCAARQEGHKPRERSRLAALLRAQTARLRADGSTQQPWQGWHAVANQAQQASELGFTDTAGSAAA